MTTLLDVGADAGVDRSEPSPAPSGRGRATAAVGLIIAANASAFAYTLGQVTEGIDLTSPVAYVPFVPVVALVAAAQRWRGAEGESPLRAHRSADWIVFWGLAAAAVVVGRGLSAAFTTETLTWRVDLATVPLVAAAVVVVVFGLRMLWRLRTVLWFLTLMSPALYRPLVERIRTVTATTTEWGVAGVSNLLPFVERTTAVAGGRDVAIRSSGEVVTLRVAEVCAGNGAVLAGLFLSASMWMLSEGSRRSKIRWSLLCVTACWAGNLVRLVAVFAATATAGEGAATGWFHQTAGVVGLILALGVSMALAHRMGLSPRPAATPPSADPGPPRLGLAAAGVLVAFALLMGGVSSNATNRFNLMTGRSAQPHAPLGTMLEGWSGGSGPSDLTLVRQENVNWAADYFGRGARWETYLTRPSGSSAVIGVDLISTSQPTSLDTYGLAACFGFHGWRMDLNRVVEMPGGRRAEEIVYTVKGAAGQNQAATPGAETRSVAVLSWRQLTEGGRVERITLQQPQPVGDWSTGDLRSLATELMARIDGGVPS